MNENNYNNSKIHILSEDVINKIAAGEVIERPASVVKELIENSIDAQSTNIYIELINSGKELIRISDNGIGMTLEDAKLSIQRYATSKITEFNDLFKLRTMGFRGEGLPSIASVSKLKLVTRTANQKNGYELVIEGGKLKSCREIGTSIGTIVEVRDLFFNTPARKKFLKSDFTERANLVHVIEELAISYYNIGFNVICESKNILSAPITKKIDERIIDIFGNEFYEGLIYFEDDFQFFKIKGFISKIEYSRPNKNSQYFFVNNRPISNRILSQVLYDTYRDSLPVNRHPTAIILIEIDPSNIDVNVHPTKRMVKFDREKEIRDLIFNTLRKNLVTQKLPVFHMSEPEFNNITPSSSLFSKQTYEQINLTPNVTDIRSTTSDKNIINDELLILGQLYDTYVLVQTSSGLVIVDQHAANERVLYEKFINLKQNGDIKQEMLIPETIEVKPSEDIILKDMIDIINQLGFNIEQFGQNTYVIKSYPAIIGKINHIKEFIKEFINIIVEGFSITQSGQLEPEEKIIRAACKAAVKAKDKLHKQELEQLLNELKLCTQPMCCPHGRPTMIHITIDELEKKFRR